MATVIIHSDFEAQEKKNCHCFYFSHFYLTWNDGTGAMISVFWRNQLFQSPLSPSSRGSLVPLQFTVVLSAYLKSLIFFLPILNPASDSSRLAFLMMYSAYKLNKQGDNLQLCRTPFRIWKQLIVPWSNSNCCFLTYIQVSQETGTVVWYSHLKEFSTVFWWSTQSKVVAQSTKKK